MKSTNRILKEVYLKSGLSIKDFATQCDMYERMIYDWLNDKHEIKYSRLELILKNYGVNVSIKIT